MLFGIRRWVLRTEETETVCASTPKFDRIAGGQRARSAEGLFAQDKARKCRNLLKPGISTTAESAVKIFDQNIKLMVLDPLVPTPNNNTVVKRKWGSPRPLLWR